MHSVQIKPSTPLVKHIFSDHISEFHPLANEGNSKLIPQEEWTVKSDSGVEVPDHITQEAKNWRRDKSTPALSTLKG